MAFKAADVTAVETWHQHSIHHLATNDAWKFGGKGLAWLADRASVRRRSPTAMLGWSIDCCGSWCENGCLLGMATVGAMALKIKTVESRRGIPDG